MKIRKGSVLLCIFALLITLTACKPPVSVDSTTPAATQPVSTTPAATEISTSPTGTESINTTPVTTEPSGTATEPDVQDVAKLTDEQCFTFIYNGRQPYPHNQPELDLSKFTLGYLYNHHKDTDTVYVIADTATAQMDITHEHIYYRPADNSKVVCSDYTGENQTVIYSSENEITWFDFNADQLLIVENQKKMILVDLTTGASECIMEQFSINEAFYFPDASDFTSEDKGRTIQWYGKATETDELNCYICYIDKNEMYIPTWH